MSSTTSPLPIREGISASRLWLPPGQWPHLLAFLVEHFDHIDEAVWRLRLEQNEVVDQVGQPLRADSPYRPGSCIHYYREVPHEPLVPFQENILFRDQRLLVVDKPHFLASIPAGSHLRETLLVRLRAKLDVPDLAPIHRLDRETAGVMLFCLDAASRGAYQSLFEQRRVRKCYEAIAPYRADLILPHVQCSRLQERPDCFLMRQVEGAPNSETRIELLERRGEHALYRLEPHTGKKHQLRAHMAALGIPILNDRWYPQPQADQCDDYRRPLKLLARSIAFADPFSGEPRHFESGLSL
jgi:tRNA pseudouridine32 synthase/23S rRNA pseudouridine746 synthase